MRELRFVRPGEDAGYVVVESATDGEQFLLPVGSDLRAALAVPAEPGQGDPSPRSAQAQPPTASTTDSSTPAHTAITPREIQIRVRAGERPEELAEHYDASLEWIMRFAGPALDERARITDEARRARARRSGSETVTVIFGEAVDERFSAHGVDLAQVRWDSRRRDDGQWVVAARWTGDTWEGGQAEHSAEWAFQRNGRSVTPLDDTAADLLSDRPIRPLGDPPAPVSVSVAPPLAPGVVAFPAMPSAHTGPLPTREQLFDQARFEQARTEQARSDQARSDQARPVQPSHHPSARAVPPAAQLNPTPAPIVASEQRFEQAFSPEPLPMHVEIPAASTVQTSKLPQVTNLGVAARDDAEQHSETETEKAARAHIPSWDDILLGVRRKND